MRLAVKNQSRLGFVVLAKTGAVRQTLVDNETSLDSGESRNEVAPEFGRFGAKSSLEDVDSFNRF